MITYKLHLIRHGQTEGNQKGLFVGRTDMPVSEEGFDELSRLRDTYEYPRVGAVYTSPLRRCIQTAEFLYPNNMLTVVDDLQEMDFGEFEGKSVAELEDNEDFGRWLADSAHNAPPGGETGLQMAERLMKALSEIFAHMMQNRITSAAVVPWRCDHDPAHRLRLSQAGAGQLECGKRQGLYHSDVAADVDAGQQLRDL